MTEIVNDLLGYEGLKIIQCPEMFNFSIDSMILAHFATINKKTKRIVDLCSGNCPIPLYLTLRTISPIIGVEIQQKAYELGDKSVKINKKEEQITLLNDDLRGISNKIGRNFNLVTCNPPFFKYNSTSNINQSEYKTIARHEVLVTLSAIVLEASKLLQPGGYFAMVHRPERIVDILEEMRKNKLEPKRLQFVYPKKGSAANHILIEGIKDGAPGLVVMKPLFVYENEKWTKEILEIYNFKQITK